MNLGVSPLEALYLVALLPEPDEHRQPEHSRAMTPAEVPRRGDHGGGEELDAPARAEALAGELELVRGEAADQADQLAELAGELQSTQEDRDQRLRALSEQLEGPAGGGRARAHLPSRAERDEFQQQLAAREQELGSAT
ncbi:MAG: hypothetical protein H0U51_00445 [Propionibacteriales bacterium]|nr:hypothetical protein [Propionibacteriales bacterium]